MKLDVLIVLSDDVVLFVRTCASFSFSFGRPYRPVSIGSLERPVILRENPEYRPSESASFGSPPSSGKRGRSSEDHQSD